MQKQIVTGVVCLIAGLMIGFFGANSLNRNPSDRIAAGTAPTVASAVPPNSDPSRVQLDSAQPDVQILIDQAANEPQNFVAQMKTGDMYAQIGRFEQAIEFYKRGLALKPDDPQANLVLANAYFDARQFENAGTQYARVLELTPDDINARADLGATFVERSEPDYAKAIAEFQTNLSQNPKHEPSLYYMGIAHLRSGNREKASEMLVALEAASPTSELIARLRQNIDVP